MFNKFKAWLIHKLGGIVVADLPKPLPVKKKEVTIIDVHASAEFTDRMCGDKEEFEKWQADILARGLAKQILEQGLVTYKRSAGRLTVCSGPHDYCLTATAYLIRESDAKIENCDAVTFHREMSCERAAELLGKKATETLETLVCEEILKSQPVTTQEKLKRSNYGVY